LALTSYNLCTGERNLYFFLRLVLVSGNRFAIPIRRKFDIQGPKGPNQPS
jgi:hypothetical protein